MFIQPCFIKKNSIELRNKLKQIGYKSNNGKLMGTYIATFKRDNDHDLFYCGTPEYDLKNSPSYNDSINCGKNQILFLDIAALRDDIDKYQWFVDKTKNYWHLSELDDFKQDFLETNSDKELKYSDFHKATVEELIEYFGNN